MIRGRGNRLLIFLLSIGLVAVSAVGQDITTFVETTDGTLLATDVYLPSAGDGPWPAVLIRTPYDKGELWLVGGALSFLGYATVIQDSRGRFESEGEDTVFRDDADDGRVTLDWVAQRPWCNGRVGGFGGSAYAVTEYLLAPGAGPSLRSVFSLVATPDLYHHAFVQGGALRESLTFNWLAEQGSLGMYEEFGRHRLKDSWWEPLEVLDHVGSITAAGFHAGGWYDIFGQGTIDAYVALQNHGGDGAAGRQYLLMGPWTHNRFGGHIVGELRYPSNAGLDPLDFMVPWLEHTVQGLDNEVATWPAVLVYLMGAVGEPDAPGNVWVELDGWPPASRSRSYFLTSDGGLASTTPVDGVLELTVDPSAPVPTLGGANLYPDLEVDGRPMGEGPHDQRPIEARDDVITFTSDVLTRPLTVMGRLSCAVWVRPDTPDLDLVVRLTDVYPDGRSMLVADGIRRARMRCGDEVECLATPGEPIELTVDLWSTALVFNTGHRIRVSVSGTNAPRFEVNPNHGGDLSGDDPPVIAAPGLLMGAQFPSRLVLPVVVSSRLPGGRIGPPDQPLPLRAAAENGADEEVPGHRILAIREHPPVGRRSHHLPPILLR